MENIMGYLVVGAVIGFVTGILAETLRSLLIFLIGFGFILYLGMAGVMTFIPAVIFGIVLVEEEK